MGANAHSRDFYWDHSTKLIELREKREYGYLSVADQQGVDLRKWIPTRTSPFTIRAR